MDSPMIRTQGLTKRFGDVVALDALDLEVARGEIFGFLGPNGAGKSTTIRLLLGLIRPTAGEAWLGGVPVTDVVRAHRSVSYVPGRRVAVAAAHRRETLELLGNVSGGVDGAVPRRAGGALRPRRQQAGPGLLQGQPAEGRPHRGAS